MPPRARSRRRPAAPPLPRAIGHVIVYVRKMKPAVAFFRDRLALPCLHESDFWTEFATEGCTLALHFSADAAPRDTGISFNVGNVDEALAALRKAGVRIVKPAAPVSDDIRCASFADPEGNVYGIAGR